MIAREQVACHTVAELVTERAGEWWLNTRVRRRGGHAVGWVKPRAGVPRRPFAATPRNASAALRTRRCQFFTPLFFSADMPSCIAQPDGRPRSTQASKTSS